MSCIKTKHNNVFLLIKQLSVNTTPSCLVIFSRGTKEERAKGTRAEKTGKDRQRTSVVGIMGLHFQL